MKSKDSVSLFTAVFFVSLFAVFFWVYSLLSCFSSFVEITTNTLLRWSLIISIGSAIASCVITNHSTRQFKQTSFSFWFGKNRAKLALGYCLSIFTFASIKSEPMWSEEIVYDILSLQWTILGLSLTIFFVWSVIIVDFLRKRQPREDDTNSFYKKYKFVLEKNYFSQEIEATFSTMLLLTINLLLLLICTSFVYISTNPDTVFTQNLLRCCFYFTTNSILGLFIDVLRPLKKEKNDLLKNNNVTKADIENAQAAVYIQAIFEGIEKGFMALDPAEYTEEDKKIMLAEFLKSFKESLDNKEGSKTATKEL